MVNLVSGMDPHSLEIVRTTDPHRQDGVHVGFIQWHPRREPHIVLTDAFATLTLSELDTVLNGYRDWRERLETIRQKHEVLTRCAAGSDGECNHPKCPQLTDRKSMCPLPPSGLTALREEGD